MQRKGLYSAKQHVHGPLSPTATAHQMRGHPKPLSMPPTALPNGIPRQAIPPIAPLPPPNPQTLETEFVAGGGLLAYGQMARALPPHIDDITSDFGDDLYERMALYPTIAKCLAIFKASILEDGVDLNPAVNDETDDDYKLATTIRDEAEAMFDDLDPGLDDVLWNMADHIAMGNTVAEQRYELKRGSVEKRELLQLVALKPKPRRAYGFVVDAYMNVVGILAALPGQANPYMGQVLLDPKNTPNLLPRAKFAIATFRPRNADPRGTSILRPAYDPWWRARQMRPEELKYMTQFGSPSIYGITPEHSQTQPPMDVFANPQLDSQGNLTPPFTPTPDVPVVSDWLGEHTRPSGTWTDSTEQKLTRALMEFRNSTAAAFVYGTEIHSLEMQGNGEAFRRYFADCDRDIVGSILTQSLATEEGQHQARAAAEVHQDVLDTLIHQGKRGMVRMIRRDILRPWVLYNWGEKALHLVPLVSLGHTEPQDLAPLITAMATVGYTIHPSQEPEIDEILNLPVRDLTQDVPIEGGPGGLPPTPAGPGQPGSGPGTPLPGKPVPPTRANRADSKPAGRAKMADGPIKPAAGQRLKAPRDVVYSADDKLLLLELFEDAYPEAAGLLDAKVTDGQ